MDEEDYKVWKKWRDKVKNWEEEAKKKELEKKERYAKEKKEAKGENDADDSMTKMNFNANTGSMDAEEREIWK